MVIPHITYGLEIVVISCKSEKILETAHCAMAKIIQGLSIQAGNIMSLPTLGWWSINSYICYKRLVLMWQILLLPMHSVYKTILINVLLMLRQRKYGEPGSYKSPIGLMYSACLKLGVIDYVYDSITTGSYISISICKSKLTLLCWKNEKRAHNMASVFYKNAILYNKCIFICGPGGSSANTTTSTITKCLWYSVY